MRALAALFLEHPAWCQAAEQVSEASESTVRFTHRPAEAWHLVRRAGRSLLLRGPSSDPDFVFRFAPGSIERLASVEGDVGDFAVALFSLFDESDENLHVGFRVVASPVRLLARGYLRLLLSAGPKVAAFGAQRGVRSWKSLRKLIQQSRSSDDLEDE